MEPDVGMTEPVQLSPDELAQAKALYFKFQDDSLEQTPLRAMDQWIASGRAPSCAKLREIGFVAAIDNDLTGDALKAAKDHAQRLRLIRNSYIRRWGFAIPCAEAIGWLRRLAPAVEIGAGSGYWTALMTAAGHDMIATDIVAEGKIWHGFMAGSSAAIMGMAADEAVRAYPERDVFCSWPTQDDGWIVAAAEQIRPGRCLALIGEPAGGCTGTPELFACLADNFQHRVRVELPQFPRINDELNFYVKR